MKDEEEKFEEIESFHLRWENRPDNRPVEGKQGFSHSVIDPNFKEGFFEKIKTSFSTDL